MIPNSIDEDPKTVSLGRARAFSGLYLLPSLLLTH
jgi:hypothetical protein